MEKTVEQLKTERREKKNKRSSYLKRKSAVDDIVSRISNKLNDNVDDVNKRIKNCADELASGLKCSISGKSVSDVCDDIRNKKEKHVDSDDKISQCESDLKSESARCQQKIDELDVEIRTLETEIQSKGGTIHFWE